LLNPDERNWLNQQKIITVGICPNLPPFEYIDENNKISGIFIDYLNLIETNIDYRFEKVYYQTWQDMLKDAKADKLDVLIEIQQTEERNQYLHFTKPIYSHPHSIIIKNGEKQKLNLNDLTNKKVAVVDQYAIHEFLIKNYPEIELLPFNNEEQCIQALYNEKADAYIAQQAIAIYLIFEKGYNRLHIAGEAEYTNDLSFACRKNLPILASILNKGTNQISNTEKQKTLGKWLITKSVPFYAKIQFWLIVCSIILIATLFLWSFNQILLKKVKERTIELEKAKIRAEESDRLKSAFLANMSHEIRTPMNAIVGFSELIERKDNHPDKQKKFASIIIKNANYLLQLVAEILDLSKIEAGIMILNPEPVNLESVFDDIHESFTPEINRKGLSANCLKPDPNNKYIINTDRQRLFQILNNLINNAIKFTEKGSISYGYMLKNNTIEFFVADTGIGIKEEYFDKVFKRFEQPISVSRQAMTGTGLGLAIVKAFIEKLGGKIWLTSELEKGSTFYFTLPL